MEEISNGRLRRIARHRPLIPAAWSFQRMNAKLIILIVLLIALFGMVYSIENTARPPSQRIGAPQLPSSEGE
jgi:hypothetical protein